MSCNSGKHILKGLGAHFEWLSAEKFEGGGGELNAQYDKVMAADNQGWVKNSFPEKEWCNLKRKEKKKLKLEN